MRNWTYPSCARAYCSHRSRWPGRIRVIAASQKIMTGADHPSEEDADKPDSSTDRRHRAGCQSSFRAHSASRNTVRRDELQQRHEGKLGGGDEIKGHLKRLCRAGGGIDSCADNASARPRQRHDWRALGGRDGLGPFGIQG